METFGLSSFEVTNQDSRNKGFKPANEIYKTYHNNLKFIVPSLPGKIGIDIYCNIINAAAKNTLVLLDNLLNWAKSQSGQLSFNPETIHLSELIQEITKRKTHLQKIVQGSTSPPPPLFKFLNS